MNPELLFQYCFMAVVGTGLGLIVLVVILALIGVGTKADDE